MVAQNIVNEKASLQEHKIKLSFQYGRFNGGNEYKNIQTGNSFGGDASYFVTDRFFITAHFNWGESDYYESYYSNSPESWHLGGGANAMLTINNIGLMAGYQLPVTCWINLSVQAGFSQWIEVRHFPMKSEEVIPYLSDLELTRFSAAFPVKFSIGFPLLKHFEAGLSAGFYIAPDYTPAIAGIYFGPQLSYVF
jgi:hypothetical protein